MNRTKGSNVTKSEIEDKVNGGDKGHKARSLTEKGAEKFDTYFKLLVFELWKLLHINL